MLSKSVFQSLPITAFRAASHIQPSRLLNSGCKLSQLVEGTTVQSTPSISNTVNKSLHQFQPNVCKTLLANSFHTNRDKFNATEGKESAFNHNSAENIIPLSIAGFAAGFVSALIYSQIKTRLSEKENEQKLIRLVLKTVKEELSESLPKHFESTEWWKQLEANGSIARTGNDNIWDPIFAQLQDAIEAAILLLHKRGEIEFIMYCIHGDSLSNTISKNTSNILKEEVPVISVYAEDGLFTYNIESHVKYDYRTSYLRYDNLYDFPILELFKPKTFGATAVIQGTKIGAKANGTNETTKGFFCISTEESLNDSTRRKLCFDGMNYPKANISLLMKEQTKELMARVIATDNYRESFNEKSVRSPNVRVR